MSIFSLQLEKYKQDFSASARNKEVYGEVNTDFLLVNKMIDLLPSELFSNPDLKWLDPCAGKGYFTMVLYKRLFESLRTKIKAPKKRHCHIIEKMIYMIELNSEHIPILYKVFGENANIANQDFLRMTNMKFDIIIGNPPFNSNGIRKVPTNSKVSKKQDGISIWINFLINIFNNLRCGGWISIITPSIWLKRDHKFHDFLLRQGEITKLHCMTNTETNRIFHSQAQTPTTFFVFNKNITNKGEINIYDSISRTYISCKTLKSIPLISPGIIQKLNEFVMKVGYLNVIKTSMRPGYKGLSIRSKKDTKHIHINISTCILQNLTPQLVTNYSNKPCSFASCKEKLVLAHKMYGFPYHDIRGHGISNRDNYVIKDYTPKQLQVIRKLLTTKLAFVIFEAARYRMKYLERYAFEFIPDITRLKNFPKNITDDTLADYFNFSDEERKYISNFIKKNYLQFI